MEALPPIEVFVGLDAIRTSAEDIPGLPTREQLQEWLSEHDRIEKETEIFDSGELKKLRTLTKGTWSEFLSSKMSADDGDSRYTETSFARRY